MDDINDLFLHDYDVIGILFFVNYALFVVRTTKRSYEPLSKEQRNKKRREQSPKRKQNKTIKNEDFNDNDEVSLILMMIVTKTIFPTIEVQHLQTIAKSLQPPQPKELPKAPWSSLVMNDEILNYYSIYIMWIVNPNHRRNCKSGGKK